MKKIVSFFLGMALACQMAVPVFAQSGTTAQQTQPNTQQTEQNNTIQSNGQTGANTQTARQVHRPETTTKPEMRRAAAMSPLCPLSTPILTL